MRVIGWHLLIVDKQSPPSAEFLVWKFPPNFPGVRWDGRSVQSEELRMNSKLEKRQNLLAVVISVKCVWYKCVPAPCARGIWHFFFPVFEERLILAKSSTPWPQSATWARQRGSFSVIRPYQEPGVCLLTARQMRSPQTYPDLTKSAVKRWAVEEWTAHNLKWRIGGPVKSPTTLWRMEQRSM